MDILGLLQLLLAQFPVLSLVFMILGTLVVIGMAVVAATPSLEDDAKWEKIKAMPIVGPLLLALAYFSPLQKKKPE